MEISKKNKELEGREETSKREREERKNEDREERLFYNFNSTNSSGFKSQTIHGDSSASLFKSDPKFQAQEFQWLKKNSSIYQYH